MHLTKLQRKCTISLLALFFYGLHGKKIHKIIENQSLKTLLLLTFYIKNAPADLLVLTITYNNST